MEQTHFDFSVSSLARGEPVNGNFSPQRDWCAAVNETNIGFGFRFMSLLSVKVWTHPVQACLRVRRRSHHQAVPAVWSVRIDLLGRLPHPLKPLFYQHVSLSFSGPLCLVLIPFSWPGRPSQCEIMGNAAWQSDTTHSPDPAPSGFNLIWSEKRAHVCVCVRDDSVLVVGGRGTRWKLGVLFSTRLSHHPSFFPNCPPPSSQKSNNSPQKSKVSIVWSKLSKNLLKICKWAGHRGYSLPLLQRCLSSGGSREGVGHIELRQ